MVYDTKNFKPIEITQLARGVGKTTLLKALFPENEHILWFNLLDPSVYADLVRKPQIFEQRIQMLSNKLEWVLIDEIQKIPQLLNQVQMLMQETSLKFVLTGSSARILRKEGAHLLGGRALINFLHPLKNFELAEKFSLESVLNRGSLPYMIQAENDLVKKEILKAYISLYLQVEIKEEQIIRQLDPFVRFLEIAALHNGKVINATKIGRESGVETSSVIRYFEILSETLLGFYLEPFHCSVRKIQTAKSKFYFFDVGVKRALENSLDSAVLPQTFYFGNNFEHFLF